MQCISISISFIKLKLFTGFIDGRAKLLLKKHKQPRAVVSMISDASEVVDVRDQASQIFGNILKYVVLPRKRNQRNVVPDE